LINILIHDSSEKHLRKDVLDYIAYSTLRQLGYDEADLSIVCEGDEKIQELNRQYRGLNQPTDVLSFPSGDINPENGRAYLGDVVISLPAIRRQAAEIGHDFLTELAVVVIHGILHLIGYDHAEPNEHEAMYGLQDRVLATLDLKEIRRTDFFKTFRNAFHGFASAYRSEKNLKVHLAFGLLAVIMAALLKISTTQWAILVLAIAAVFTAEFLNTALEHVVNLASPRYNKLAKMAKDISAAGVLISVIAAVVVGGLLFIPRLLPLIASWFSH
jgi:rRNA maturation RNase YbeY